jgi:hypothetical protein
MRAFPSDTSEIIIAPNLGVSRDRGSPNQPLLAVRVPVVLSGKHRLIENGFALCQVDRVFAQVELSLGRVIAHRYLSYMHLSGVATVPHNKQLQRTVMDKVPSHLGQRAAAKLRR